MKKIFVADTDETFQASINSLTDGKSVKVEFYSSSMDVLPQIDQEQPSMIFVNLELPDMNDFVMYDLLKKADMTPPIPVFITFSPQSEKDLGKYKKLKFKPEGYYKKPMSHEDIDLLLSRHLGAAANKKKDAADHAKSEEAGDYETTAEEEDGVIFTQVPAEMEDKPKSHKEKTREMKHGVFQVSDGDAEMVSKTGKDLAERVISLEKQNRFLREENKGLSKDIEYLKKELDKKGETLGQEKSQVESNVKDLETKITELEEELHEKEAEFKKFQVAAENEKAELTEKITDMQREMVAKDHEFEKKLNEETNSMLHQAEQRLINDFRETEERLRADIGRLENEKSRVEATHVKELDAQKTAISEMQDKIDILKGSETALNASISALKDEKAALSQDLKDAEKKIKSLEEEKESFNQRLMCSEEDLENMTKNKESLAQKLAETEKKVSDLENLKQELVQEHDKLLKQKEKKESELTASIEKISAELDSTTLQLNDHKDRIEKLEKLLLKAVSLTQTSH